MDTKQKIKLKYYTKIEFSHYILLQKDKIDAEIDVGAKCLNNIQFYNIVFGTFSCITWTEFCHKFVYLNRCLCKTSGNFNTNIVLI